MGDVVSKLVREVVVAALLCLLVSAPVFSQQTEPSAAEAPAETTEAKPIPAAQIADRRLDTAALLRNAAEKSSIDGEVRAIRDEFSAKKTQLQELQSEALRQLKADGPVSIIEESERVWSRAQDRLDQRLRTLSTRADDVASVLEKVRAEKALWVLTRDSSVAEELPPELKQAIRETLESIDQVEQQVRSSRDSVLNLQSSVGHAKARADEILAALREEIKERKRAMMAADSPALWAVFTTSGPGQSLSEQVAATWRTNSDLVRNYASLQRDRLLRYLIALLVLVAGLIFLRQKGRLWVQQDRSLEPALNLLERPVAAGVTIIVLFCDLLDPNAPTAWSAVLGLFLLVAMLRLLPRVLVTTGRSWAYILAALFFLHQMARLTPDGSTLHRLALLGLSLAGFAASVWLARKMRPGRSGIPEGWLRFIRLVARSAAALFLVGSIANITGSVGFAMVLVTGTLRAILGAVVLLVVAVLMRALVRVVMLLGPVRRLGIVSQRGEVTRQVVFRGITAILVFVWVMVTLKNFMVLDPVINHLRALIEFEISIGNFTLTPFDVLIFAFVIWLSFKISRLLSFALEADILPHMHLPRGVPAAVTKLTSYTVIVIGVIIAFSAAGFAFDRITIIFGALGVGIGFGLQNVVSNFVAGLILLFERPIQVGDRVQLTTVEGVVTDIGMRASTIRSYSGAEIVVPNSNFVSAELINWTLRDRTRRMEITVGVAYGTDPGTVIDILAGVATQHPQVDDHPRPQALFMDFGESSLDFQLRAWTAAGRHLGVGSDLRVAIAQALKEASIEIPFPQRDLHLRSVDDTVALQARGESSDVE